MLANLRLRRGAALLLIGPQLVGDVVLVDVADVGDRLAADPLRGHALDVPEPDVGVEAPLLGLAPELPQPSRPAVVGRNVMSPLLRLSMGSSLKYWSCMN